MRRQQQQDTQDSSSSRTRLTSKFIATALLQGQQTASCRHTDRWELLGADTHGQVNTTLL